MSSKAAKKKGKTKSTAIGITAQLTEYVTAFVAIMLCIVVPFYAKEKYNQIGEAKFSAYKTIMLPGLAVLILLGILYIIFFIREKKKLRLSITDLFVTAYLIMVGISVISGGFYKDALWGSAGWNMGFFSQLSFVLLYLFLSRFGKYYRHIIITLCAAATIVFVLGILNRMLIDPLGFYDGLENFQKAQFLSTLGQATWYASFMIVVLPIGIAVFLYADNEKWRVAGVVFTFIGFCTLVSQNSDSAYFALLGFMLVFLWNSVKTKKLLLRYILTLAMFFASGKLMYFLLQINPNPDLQFDFVTDLILSSPITWGMLVICIAAYATLLFLGKTAKYPAKKMSLLCIGLYIATGVGIVTIIITIILNAHNLLPAGLAEKISTISYLNWDEELWGNGRSRIWLFSTRMFLQEDIIHKLFGIGPDCFNSYAMANHRDTVILYWGGKILTNAHNEWLNILINAGIFGVIAYLGSFISAFRRFMRYAEQNFLLTGIAACIISYMAYNFFCYQQILCTPFLFILMGIGEYLVRESSAD